MDSTVLNTISLCSGVGMLDEGFHSGLEFVGIRSRTVMFAEREAFPVSVLAARMEEGSLAPAPIWFGDFTELPARRFRGLVDGIVAGFPCQDLSVAGRRAGLNGKRSGLFFNVLDIADDSGAWFLVLENVAGIASATASVVDEASTSDYATKSSGDGFSDVGIEDGMLLERAASRVMGELADRGWNAEWITLSASNVGASHGRARWFCFAWRVADTRLQHGDIQQRIARAEYSGSRIAVDDAQLSKRWAQRVGVTGSVEGHDRGRPEENGWAGIANQALGHAECARWPQTRSGFSIDAGCEFESGCRAVAHSTGTRLCGRKDSGANDADAPQGSRCIEFERSCAELANTDRSGLQRIECGRVIDSFRGGQQNGSTSECRSIFAPGPSDSRWPGLLARFPWLAPAIGDKEAESLFCRVDDELASGLDFSYRAARLRACGNGVVPIQAASAFVVLVRRSGIFKGVVK